MDIMEGSVGENKGRTYNVEKRPNALTATKSPFIQYNGAYIRKSTALYLLQENFQLSSDRLLRVRSEQPKHIFSSTPFHGCGHQETAGMPEAHWGTGGQTFLKGTFGRGIRKKFGRGILKTKRYIVLTVNANCLTALLC